MRNKLLNFKRVLCLFLVFSLIAGYIPLIEPAEASGSWSWDASQTAQDPDGGIVAFGGPVHYDSSGSQTHKWSNTQEDFSVYRPATAYGQNAVLSFNCYAGDSCYGFYVRFPAITEDMGTWTANYPSYYGTTRTIAQRANNSKKLTLIEDRTGTTLTTQAPTNWYMQNNSSTKKLNAGLYREYFWLGKTVFFGRWPGNISQSILDTYSQTTADFAHTFTPSGKNYYDIKPRTVSFQNLKTTKLTGQNKTVLMSTAGSNAKTGDLANISFPGESGTLKPTIYVHNVTGISGNNITTTKYLSDPRGNSAISTVSEPGLYYVSAITPLLFPIASISGTTPTLTGETDTDNPTTRCQGYYSNYYVPSASAAADNGINLSRVSFSGTAYQYSHTERYGEEYVLYMKPTSFGTYYVDDNPKAALTISPSSSRFNFYSSTADWTKAAGSKTIQLYTNLKTNAGTSGYALDTATVTVRKYDVSRADNVTAANSNPARNTPFSGLGLPTTTTVYGVVPSGRATAPSVSGVPIIWDESTWDPTSRATQTVRGTVDISGNAEASRIFNNASPTVTATITPQQTLPSSVDFPNKTVEYTGSPISHEVTSVVGGTVAGYRYVCAELGYDSTEPPTAIGIYEVTATFNQDPDYDELSPATSILTITKQSQTLPDGLIPELDHATPTSITLKPGPGDGPYEYGIIINGNIHWSDDVVFTDLSPDTEYDFVIRLKETDIKFPSEPSEPATFSTLDCEATNTISADTLTAQYPTPVTLESNVTHNLGDGTTITYQWYKDGTAIEGATDQTLELTNVADSGQYYCVATLTKDSFTTDVTSDTVEVSITAGSIIPNLLPENWKDYLLTDPITYGQTLGDTNIRLDIDRLIADGYPNAGEVTIAYKDPSIVPTVPSSLTGVGTYDVTLTASVVNIEATQDVTINETDITVNPAPLTIKANDIGITYGDDPTTAKYDVTITGFVNGDTATDLTGTTTYTSDYNTQWQNRPESGTADILPGGVSNPNYDITFDTGVLTINKKDCTYFVDDAEKIYGNPDPAYNKIFADGTLEAFPEVVQQELKDLLQSAEITRDPGEDVGTYKLHIPVVESTNFKIATILFTVGTEPTLTVVPKPVVVDWTTPYPSWTNGTDRSAEVSASYLDISGAPVALDVSITQDEVVVPFQEKGEYLAHAVDISAGKDNYDPQGLDKILSLKDRNSTENVIFPTASPIELYQKLKDSALTGGNGGETGTGTYQWVDPEFMPPQIGTQMYDVIFTPSPDDKTDYSSEVGWDPDTNTITRKVMVEVTAVQAVDPDIEYERSKTYDGTTNIAVMASDFIHIRPEHDVTVTITASFEDKNVGDNKKIHVHFDISGPDADLYVVPADFDAVGSILPAPLTITANDAELQFGDELGDTKFTAEGFVHGETVAELEGTVVYDYDGYHQWDDIPNGPKTITISGLTAQNYAITFKPGTLTLTKRVVRITPDPNQSKIYDDPDPTFTYKYDLRMVGDLPRAVQDEFDGNPITIGRAEGESVRQYPFICTTTDTKNFTYEVVDGEVFTINKKPVLLSWVGLDTPYFENGEDQSELIYAFLPMKDGSSYPVRIKWSVGENPVDGFINAGRYNLDADITDLYNYEVLNPSQMVIMGSQEDAENLKFPYAIPILKGDSLRESNLVNGIGDGTFDWTDDTIIPDESGYFPVTFVPLPDNDVSTQPGYDPETNTVTRPVYVEVWDGPFDIPVQDEDVWQKIKDAGLLDKIYDSNNTALLSGTAPLITRNPSTGMYELATDPAPETVVHNRTKLTKEQINLFYSLLYGDKLTAILQMLGNNLLTVDVNGTYENQHAGVDKPMTFHFAVSGDCARLFTPGKKDTTGTIEQAKLLVLANDAAIDTPKTPEGNGVVFPPVSPEEFNLSWEQEGEIWEYGFVGTDSIASLGGTLDYRFVAYKEDGTEVAYSPRELYAAPFYVIPQGLTSTDYELHFLAGDFSAPNIHPDPGSEFEDWTGKRPNPPIMDSNTDHSITLKPIPLGQYSLDGGKTWQDPVEFDNLTPNTTYPGKQRIPDPKNPGEYLVSDPANLKTRDPNDNPNRPNPPQIKDKTDTTIEVIPIPGGQYSIDDGKTWQDSPIFPGLTPDTEYEIIQRIPDPSNPGGYLVSDPTTERTDPLPDPSKPPRPVIDDVTDTTISVKPIPDGQYSIDGGNTWQDSPIFEGLDPDTEYEIIQRVPDPNNPGDYIVSDPTHVRTDPEPGDNTIGKPIIDNVTENTISARPIPGGQYSIDDGKTWQDSPIFTGLRPNTEYQIIQRVPDPKNPGEYLVSDPTSATTKPVEDPEYTIHFPPETIDYDNTKWDLFEDPECTKPILSGGQITPEAEVYFKHKGTGAVVPVKLPSRPNSPVLSHTDETVDGANDGTIFTVTDAMEFSTDGGKTWLPCPNGALRGLAPGTYLVRYKATDTSFASLPTIVEIRPGDTAETPKKFVQGEAGNNGYNKGYNWSKDPPEKATFGSGDTEIVNPYVPLAGIEGCPSAQYVDVDQTQWYHDPVDFTVANNLMIGYTAVEWGPTRDMTRFQALQVLYRLAGSPQGYDLSGIEDIPPTFWAYKALAWAYNMGLTTGLTHTTFGPDESITYEQFADMFYKFCQLYGISPTPGAAPTSYDETKTQSEYQPAMSAMSASGIFGVQGAMVINPKDTFVRTTGAQIVTNFCTLYRTQISRIGSMNSLPATYRNPGVLNVRGVLYS